MNLEYLRQADTANGQRSQSWVYDEYSHQPGCKCRSNDTFPVHIHLHIPYDGDRESEREEVNYYTEDDVKIIKCSL